MKLSELKILVDKATAQAAKHRIDPLVVTVDFRNEAERERDISGNTEELRHVEEAGLIEMRSLEPACSSLAYSVRDGMFANHPVFYLTADDTKGIL